MAWPPINFYAGDGPRDINVPFQVYGIVYTNLSAQWVYFGGGYRYGAPQTHGSYYVDGEQTIHVEWAAPPGQSGGQPAAVAGQVCGFNLTPAAQYDTGSVYAAPGMINPMTTAGDIIFGGGSGAPQRLAIGTANQVLIVGGNPASPAWSNTLTGITLAGTVSGTPVWGSSQAITLSTAAQPNVTSLGTLAANLLFVDATYDIGASGATRPRDIWTSRNVRSGGVVTLGDDGVTRSDGSLNFNPTLTLNIIGGSGNPSISFNTTGNFGRWQMVNAGHLIASVDNASDIGTTGANRPRDIWLARNARIAGVIVVGDDAATRVAGSIFLNTGGPTFSIVGGSGATAFNFNRSDNNATFLSLSNTGNAVLLGKYTSYNAVTTAGWGVPGINGYGRSVAQTAAVASIAAYIVGAADGSFIVSGNVLVTASATHSFSMEVAYTDESNVARVVTFNVQQLGGTLVTAITNITGLGPYEGVPLHIRCKASTSITIRTNAGGTYTSVTYNAEGAIQEVA